MVPSLFPSTTNYTLSDTEIKIYYTNMGFGDIGLNNTILAGFISVHIERELPQIEFSLPNVCIHGIVTIQSKHNFDVLAYDWLIYENNPNSQDLHFESSSSSQFLWNPNKSGSFMVRHRVQDSKCGWSVPAFSTISVLPIGPMSISTDLSSNDVCIDSPKVFLRGNPQGGNFSGPGIINNNMFDPSQAGEGVFQLTYTFQFPNGCIGTTTLQLTVHPKPVVSIIGLDDTFVSTSLKDLNN